MSGKNPTSVENVSTLPDLSEDLLRLLDRPSPFSDAVLKCGGVEIPVHRCILSARSPVFAAMFQSEMREGRSGDVDIVDIELGVLQVMLRYLYSGKTDSLTDSIAEELLFAADKYGLQDLKRICIDKLVSALSVDNVIRILILGHLHDSSLKERAKEFICKCEFSDLEGKKEWESLQEEHPKLAMEVMRSVVKYVQESSRQKEANTCRIIVRYTDNPDIPFEVAAVDTIADLKQRIQVNACIPPDQQRLYFQDRERRDSSTLSECGISDNSVFLLKRCMEVIVKDTHGRTRLTTRVENRAPIETLKEIIYGEVGIPADLYCLVCDGRQLEDGRSFDFYGVTPQSTIHLAPRLRGGFL